MWPDVPQGWIDACTYLIVGREIASTGTRHYQGYMCLLSKQRLTAVKKLFLPHCPHLEVMRGSPLQAATYCRKDHDFVEFGALPIGDATSKWTGVRQAAQNGNFDVIDDSVYITHLPNLLRIHDLARPVPVDLPLTSILVSGFGVILGSVRVVRLELIILVVILNF